MRESQSVKDEVRQSKRKPTVRKKESTIVREKTESHEERQTVREKVSQLERKSEGRSVK